MTATHADIRAHITQRETPVTTMTRPDSLVGEWADETLAASGDEYTDLDTALYQHARIGDYHLGGVDRQMGALVLLGSVDRLRHWQATSAAPQGVRDAMGVLAADIRRWAGRLYDVDLVDEVDRLRAELAAATA